MEATELLQSILNQSVLSGVMFFFLWKVWEAYLKEKEKKDTLAEALVKITFLWEDRYSVESQDDRDIKIFMQEIRDILKNIDHAK